MANMNAMLVKTVIIARIAIPAAPNAVHFTSPMDSPRRGDSHSRAVRNNGIDRSLTVVPGDAVLKLEEVHMANTLSPPVSVSRQRVSENDLVSIFRIFNVILNLFAPILFLANSVAPWVSLIWLGCLHEWGILFTQLWAGRSAEWLIGIAFYIPNLLCGTAVEWARQRNNRALTYSILFLTYAVRYLVMSVWVASSFKLVLHAAHPAALIPACIAAFCIATAPWTNLLQTRSESEGADALGILMCNAVLHVTSLGLAVAFGLSKMDFWQAFHIINVVLLFLAFFQVKLAVIVSEAIGQPLFVEKEHDSRKPHRMRWYESIWAYSPLLLVFCGGLVPALIGAVPAYVNHRIFRTNIPTILKFVATIGTSVSLLLAGFVLVDFLMHLTPHR